MKIAESFLSLVKRASADLDVERIREDVRSFSSRHPDLPAREKAHLMVESTARRAALVGAAAGAPPGWAAVAATAPELTTLIVLQSRMIVGLHLLYGGELDAEERALEVVAGLAAGAGLSVGRRIAMVVAEELAARVVPKAAGKRLAPFAPLAGIVASAALDYAAVRAVGRAVIARVERKWGRPELPGAGPILDTAGRVA